ncbi:MAG: hypothetical protein ACJAU8_000501 [Candidatus Paceibacteria bacterium]|jgi:hypothetical protein
MLEPVRNTQLLIAERIFNYYLQIIEIKKAQNVETFMIDVMYGDREVSLVHLTDKYDGKSVWREKINIKDEDDWFTLPGSFRDAFDTTDRYYVNIEDVLKKVSMMLAKKGIASYFDDLTEDQPLFTGHPGAKALHIVV